MAVRILIDSSADVFGDEAKTLGVDVIPIKLLIENKEYADGVDLTPHDFYVLLRKLKQMPKTSQVNAYEFKQFFDGAIENGDEVVAILISSKLSGTYHSAQMAVLELPTEERDRISIIDSETVTTPLKALVYEAVNLRNSGKSAKEIAEQMECMKRKVRLYAAINDLKYLRDNGRLSNGAAFLGALLSVKPMISIVSGQVVAQKKCVGMTKARLAVCQEALDSDIDLERPIYIGHTDNVEEGKSLLSLFEKKLGKSVNARFEFIGSTVGIHAGPDSAALVFFVK